MFHMMFMSIPAVTPPVSPLRGMPIVPVTANYFSIGFRIQRFIVNVGTNFMHLAKGVDGTCNHT
jgi:hypothetical protein